jgi:hypothetical protein
MLKHTELVLSVCLSALALAANDGDAVNERIVVNKADMEAHWRVDCAVAWVRLQTAAAGQSRHDQCEITADLVREIKLCAFIYQAPGGNSPHSCPDYRSASQQLELRSAASGCPSLPPTIVQRMKCNSTDH